MASLVTRSRWQDNKASRTQTSAWHAGCIVLHMQCVSFVFASHVTASCVDLRPANSTHGNAGSWLATLAAGCYDVHLISSCLAPSIIFCSLYASSTSESSFVAESDDLSRVTSSTATIAQHGGIRFVLLTCMVRYFFFFFFVQMADMHTDNSSTLRISNRYRPADLIVISLTGWTPGAWRDGLGADCCNDVEKIICVYVRVRVLAPY